MARSPAHSPESTSPKMRKLSLAKLLCGISCGATSLALATAPAQVRAQAVQGTATVQFGASVLSSAEN